MNVWDQIVQWYVKPIKKQNLVDLEKKEIFPIVANSKKCSFCLKIKFLSDFYVRGDKWKLTPKSKCKDCYNFLKKKGKK